MNPKRDVTFLNPPTSNKKSVIRDLNRGKTLSSLSNIHKFLGVQKIALDLILPWFCPHHLTIHLPFMVDKWTGKMKNKYYLFMGFRVFQEYYHKKIRYFGCRYTQRVWGTEWRKNIKIVPTLILAFKIGTELWSRSIIHK